MVSHIRLPVGCFAGFDQLSRAAARRSSVWLIVERLRSVRSSIPDIFLLNSNTDSGLRSSLHSVTRQPVSVGSKR